MIRKLVVTLQPKGCETAHARQLMHASLLSLNRSFGTEYSRKYVFIMATVVLQVPDESLVSKVKNACKMLVGVTSVTVKKSTAESRLYDPETGKYLNKKTMKVIEDAHKGIGVTRYDSVDDLFRSVLGEDEFKKIRSNNV